MRPITLQHLLAAAALILCPLLTCSTHANVQELRAAAGDLMNSLTPTQREAISFELEDDKRATWSNLPTAMAPPAGVMLGTLSDEQRKHVHRMMQSSLSSQGYTKTAAIMWLDDILRAQEKANLEASEEARNNPIQVAMAENRSSGNYAIAVFGDPGDANWGWKITGHHLAINISVAGDKLGALPGYYGSNPRIVQEGPYAGYMALGTESELGIALMTSLSAEQRATATVGNETPADVIEGPGRRGSLEKYEGLSAKSLKGEQLGLLQRLVGEYVRNAKSGSAAAHLDQIASDGWDALHFSWRGPVDMDGQFYYRVHGPRVLIEYNRQNPNHDHAVIRDPKNDYGEDWLGIHYKEEHPSQAEYMGNLRRAAGIAD